MNLWYKGEYVNIIVIDSLLAPVKVLKKLSKSGELNMSTNLLLLELTLLLVEGRQDCTTCSYNT